MAADDRTGEVDPGAMALRLAARIRRHGPIGFDEFQHEALYGEPGGFYTAGGRAGRRGDFLTSPEVGPLFGAVVARALDTWWREAGEPPVFTVVDAGAGPGTLAASVLAARPDCGPALRYVLVERSASQRARQRALRLPWVPPDEAFAGPDELDDDDRETGDGLGGGTGGPGVGAEPGRRVPPSGPIVVSLPELPPLDGPAVVLANELLDNLPVMLFERRDGRWWEVRVGLAAPAGPSGPRFEEVLVPAPDALAASLPDVRDGGRVPWAAAAVAWLRSAVDALRSGRVVVFDYGVERTAELGHRDWRTWLRTYRAHGRGGSPYDAPGSQDVTCDVPFDQLGRAVPGMTLVTQAAFLREHGIEELVAEGRARWAAGAATADLAALAGRSRVREAEALLDPGGLGAFQVATWTVG